EVYNTVIIKDDNSLIKAYWYNDDNTSIYLYSLMVDEKFKKQGIGKLLIQTCERLGLSLGATHCCLWVIKDSWMHNWYKRLKYKDWINNNKIKNTIWMRKKLI